MNARAAVMATVGAVTTIGVFAWVTFLVTSQMPGPLSLIFYGVLIWLIIYRWLAPSKRAS